MAKRHRILIIDDSRETVVGLKAYLVKKYHVLTAYNGRDGIKKYDKNEGRIDLILTELILPDAIGCVFRTKPATDSDRFRPPIPEQSGHPVLTPSRS